MKPAYDRKSNLIVLCTECHTKVHHGMISAAELKRKKSKKKKKKTKKRKKKKKKAVYSFPKMKIPKIKVGI